MVLVWTVFGYLLLWGVRYLLSARIYLTCALRGAEVRPVSRRQLDPAELQLLAVPDSELTAAGFHHVGFAQITPLLTCYGSPLAASIFVNEHLPAYAVVRRRAAPEYRQLMELTLTTAFCSGYEIDTLNAPVSGTFSPASMRLEARPELSIAALVGRHAERVVAERAAMEVGDSDCLESLTLEDCIARFAANLAELRSLFRQRGWIVPTADPCLDRFTLRGAFALAHQSVRSAARRRERVQRTLSMPQPTPAPAGGITNNAPRANVEPTDDERRLRVEADLQAVMHVSENPAPAPGTPWPLIAVVFWTAAISFLAMASLWNASVAALILAVVSFHEAGHAAAMRMLGYRDVHVFFVPLLGAMTVGRSAAATVRDRLAVLLAGPVPGLWLAVVLLAIDQTSGPFKPVRMVALALVVLNGLNLLPFTPLDGGRALELLSRPESPWRLAVHGLSAVGLLAVGIVLGDPLITALGAFWALLLPRQLMSYRLRRSVAAVVDNRMDFRAVVRAALEAMTDSRYASWRSGARQLNARAIARLFCESTATSADRGWGAMAYAFAWIPLIVALLLWAK